MSPSRRLLIFDESVHPSSWNERMNAGEYAVHNSSFAPGQPPSCEIFQSLADAEQHALAHVAAHPQVRCRIYDHAGFGKPPMLEISGTSHKGEGEIGPRFRRWGGSGLFLAGLTLIAYDALNNFELSWPAMIGSRLIIPGLVLLVIEAVLILQSRRDSRDTLVTSTRRSA